MTTFLKAQAATRPTAMGSLLQSSAYGAVIPNGYGQTQSPLLAIWAANLRQGGHGSKKFKMLKKGITNYIEAIDFLIGHSPVMGVLQVQNNGATMPVAFTSESFTSVGGRQSFAVSDPHFYMVIAVTLEAAYSFDVDDYGAQGPQTLAGTYEIPLWNELETGPDPTDPMSYRCWPYCYRWQPGFGVTVQIDAEAFPAGTLRIYYAQLLNATHYEPPIQRLSMAFEPQLGSGGQYADAGLGEQQIIYPQFAGLGSAELDLGASGALPQLNPEVRWKWGVYPSGDADFVDMIEDICKSGLAQAAIAADTADAPIPAGTQMERGLSSYDLPGTIQKKVDAHAGVALPPMHYNMPCSAGNILVVVVTAAGTLTISSSAGESWTAVYADGLGYQVWYAEAKGGADTVTVSGASAPWSMGIFEIGGVGGSIARAIFVHPTTNSNGNHIGASTNAATSSSTNTTCELGISGSYPPTRLFESASAFATWGGFEWPGLPAGAVVTAIKPVITYSFSQSGPDGAVVLIDITPGFPGGGAVTPLTTWTGPTIGTLPSDLTSYTATIQIEATVPLTNYGGGLVVTDIGLLVEYDLPGALFGGEVVDAVATSSRGAASVTSTVPPDLPGYLMAISLYAGGGAPVVADAPLWDAVTPRNFAEQSPARFQAQDRIIYSPGTYAAAGAGGSPDSVCLLALKAVQPVSYPRPLGDFIDLPAADLVRAQCRANGLKGSLVMTAQTDAAELIDMLCQAADCAPVFLGSKLFLFPYSEVSAAGNGAFYAAPSAAGPVATLDADKGDFVGADGCPKLTTVDRVGLPNVLQMQCIDRNANYDQVTVQVPACSSLALYGLRKGKSGSDDNSVVVNNAVQDPTVARTILGIQVRRNQQGGDVWEFTAAPRHALLAPMDLITLTDRLQGIVDVPVRITSYEEQADGSFAAKAEPFIYGMCAPVVLPAVSPVRNPSPVDAGAGNVNAPIIFEPTPGLYPGLSSDQIWLVISCINENYGGAQVFVSADGGASYNPAPGGSDGRSNIIVGSAVTGRVQADWPAAADPDTTNDLTVDLEESHGALESYLPETENNFVYPCYVEAGQLAIGITGVVGVNGSVVSAGVPNRIGVGGGSSADVGTMGVEGSTAVVQAGIAEGAPLTLGIDGTVICFCAELGVNGVAVADGSGFGYELMSYAIAASHAPVRVYTLKATDGHFLRRAILDAPNTGGMGVDHGRNSRFALLDPGGQGILKLALPSQYIGQTLYFKICSFNTFGSALQSLGDVDAYAYIPTGIPGSV